MGTVPISEKHRACRDALADAMQPFDGDIKPPEMLAIVSQMVGQLIAVQDPDVITPEIAMDLILHNITIGNEAAGEYLDEVQRGAT